MNSDPASAILPLLSSLLGPKAAPILTAIVGWVTLASLISSVILALVPPPDAGGWKAKAWKLLTLLAVARGYLKPAYQPGKTAIMSPVEQRGDMRDVVAAAAGVSREETKP